MSLERVYFRPSLKSVTMPMYCKFLYRRKAILNTLIYTLSGLFPVCVICKEALYTHTKNAKLTLHVYV